MKVLVAAISTLIWITGCNKDDKRAAQDNAAAREAAAESRQTARDVSEGAHAAANTAAAETRDAGKAVEGVFLKDQGLTAEDAQVNEKIRAALKSDKDVGPQAPDVAMDTRNGVVTLHGTVTSNSARDNVVRIANGIAGQPKVVSDIKVDPNYRHTANAVTGEVREETRQTARDIGEGVDKAGNKIAEETRQTARDISEAWPGDKGKTEADESLTHNIRAALKTDSDNDIVRESKDVNINTENGKVTLKGTVTSNAVRKDIGKIAARVAGKTVDNDIKVAERVGTGPDAR